MSANITAAPVRGARAIITEFTFRNTIKGALIFATFASVENLAQGLGIVKAYPDAAARARVVHDLAANPALGMLYGDSHANIGTPAGYMVYRNLALLSLIGAIWGLLFISRMLRGQEEDGRWELLLSSPTTPRRATAKTLAGAALGLAGAYVLIALVVVAVGKSNKINISLRASLFYALTLVAGAAVFMAVGTLTSQLAATRRRAVLYGAMPLLVLFIARGIGSVTDSLAWLKYLTPFGWIDKTRPLTNPQPLWLLPAAALIAACIAIALYLVGRRDAGESLIADSDSAKPRYKLLKSQLGFDFRMNRWVLLAWLAGSAAFSGLFAGVAKTAANSLTDSGGISKALSKLSGNASATIEMAFLSVSGYFVALLLMVMVINGLGSVREEEGSGRLDNFLTRAVSRSRWLGARLAILAGAAVIICLVSALVVWLVAAAQHIDVDAAKLIVGGLNVLAPVALLLGAGVLIYGLWPRVATMVMYAWLAWSFTVDILTAILKLNRILLDSSLLHYIALVPATEPDWRKTGIVAAIGLALAIAGIFAFTGRDLQAE